MRTKTRWDVSTCRGTFTPQIPYAVDAVKCRVVMNAEKPTMPRNNAVLLFNPIFPPDTPAQQPQAS